MAAAVLALVILGRPPLAAQGNRGPLGQARALLAEATSLLEAGDTAEAIERLKAATEAAPGMSEAHYRYGQLLARTAGNGVGDWFHRRRASQALDRALDLDRQNPAILLEIARLKLKTPFLRLDAKRIFSHALEAAKARGDPTLVAEVNAEIGDIYYRRYQAQEHRRMIVGPAMRFDPTEAVTDPDYTRRFLSSQTAVVPGAGELDLRAAEEHYRAGVSADPGNEAAAAAFLGVLYDRGRYEEYLEAARLFASTAGENGRAQLLLGLGYWRVGRNREALRAFDRALELMPPADRATLTNLSVILRRSDAQTYQALSDSQRAEYERRYWYMADPLRLTEENEHRLEHLARVAYADLRFSAPDLNLRGWQTDQGAIYIRYGPPPEIAKFAPEASATGGGDFNVIAEHDVTARVSLEQAGKVVTVWYYPERNLPFVFYGPPGYNFARFAGEFQAFADDARYTIPVKYDNVPVNEALDSIPVQTAAFREQGGGGTEVVFFAEVPVAAMVSETDLRQGQLETGFFVTEPSLHEVVARRGSEAVNFQASSQFQARTFEATLRPGEYLYRVEARQPVTGRAARGMAALGVEDFSRATLMLSDVILADRVQPRSDSVTGRRDFFLQPNPSMTFEPGEPVHLYWEVYGLQPDSAAIARYDVEISIRVQAIERRSVAARIVGGVLDAVGVTAAGDERLAIVYDREQSLAGRDRIPEHLAIELDDAPNGVYSLEVAVTDRVSGQSFVRRRAFTITDTPSP